MMMMFTEVKYLILMQIGMDIAIFAVFVFLISRLRTLNRSASLPRGMETMASVLAEADKTAEQFKKQLEEKKELMKTLGEQLDNKIMSINVLLNRADVLFEKNERCNVETTPQAFPCRKEKEIVELHRKGHRPDQIADSLSISKEEVKLVLELKQKNIRSVRKEGAF